MSTLSLNCAIVRQDNRQPADAPPAVDFSETGLTVADLVALVRQEANLVVSQSHVTAAFRFRPAMTWTAQRGGYTTTITATAARPQRNTPTLAAPIPFAVAA